MTVQTFGEVPGFGFTSGGVVQATEFVGTDFVITASGIFYYSGSPAFGNLVQSMVGPGVTSDPFGNTVFADGLAIYGSNGQSTFLGQVGGLSFVKFPSGASFEETAANIAAGIAGSGAGAAIEFVISGPQAVSSPSTDDWTQIQFISGEEGGSVGAGMAFNYINTFGGVDQYAQMTGTGFHILTGSVNGITPGSFALSFAGSAAGAPPTSGGTVAGSFGGNALTYLTALASTYNNTVTAVNDIVNGLDGWSV